MRDYTEDIQQTANRFRIIGEAGCWTIMTLCHLAMLGIVVWMVVCK